MGSLWLVIFTQSAPDSVGKLHSQVWNCFIASHESSSLYGRASRHRHYDIVKNFKRSLFFRQRSFHLRTWRIYEFSLWAIKRTKISISRAHLRWIWQNVKRSTMFSIKTEWKITIQISNYTSRFDSSRYFYHRDHHVWFTCERKIPVLSHSGERKFFISRLIFFIIRRFPPPLASITVSWAPNVLWMGAWIIKLLTMQNNRNFMPNLDEALRCCNVQLPTGRNPIKGHLPQLTGRWQVNPHRIRHKPSWRRQIDWRSSS